MPLLTLELYVKTRRDPASVSEVVPNTSAHYSQREMLSFSMGNIQQVPELSMNVRLSLDITASFRSTKASLVSVWSLQICTFLTFIKQITQMKEFVFGFVKS